MRFVAMTTTMGLGLCGMLAACAAGSEMDSPGLGASDEPMLGDDDTAEGPGEDTGGATTHADSGPGESGDDSPGDAGSAAEDGSSGDGDTGEPPAPPVAVEGLWFSPEDIADLPMSGPAWEELLAGANQDLSQPNIGDQDDRTGLYCFAAAIVWTRDPMVYAEHYERATKCLDDLVAAGDPSSADAVGDGRSLAWARNGFGYAATADLLDYRPPEVVAYMEDLADSFICTQMEVTLFEMATLRPNNWGTLGLGSLAAIYVYLGNEERLDQLHTQIEAALEGPVQPYADDRWDLEEQPSWQEHPEDPSSWRLITPAGLTKDGLDLDGIVPEDMQRGEPGAFDGSSYTSWSHTNYPWETIQGLATAARVLERRGYPVWSLGDSAILRAVERYNRLADESGNLEWAARTGNARAWVLPFVDDAYGSDTLGDALAADPDNRDVFGSGRIAGWAWVLGEG
jgi:hypothetical protein